MPDRPAPLGRLDSLLSASAIAHEAIFDMRHELTSTGRCGAEPDELLRESAMIAATRLPDATARARSLARRWGEQTVLDPDAAAATVHELAAELERIEPEIRRLIDRQRRIAARLHSMLGE
ncbi:MAG: hypothetical protein ACRDK9_07725 [Solirubrobacterales bacterium]